jgi:hypothetical protein
MNLLREKQKLLPMGNPQDMGGGGGGSAPAQQTPTTQTVTNTSIPEYARPYAETLLGKSQALTSQDQYQPYQGQRVAGFSPMQQQSFEGIQNMQVAPQIAQGTGLAGMAGLGSLGAGANYAAQATNPNAVAAYMSPYMQNAVDWQKQQAIMDYNRQLPGLGASAPRAGAFGGSRQAIVESEAQRNLQNQLAGIQATGTQNAFQNAQQAQQFGANLGLQGYGQAGALANTLGQLGQTQYGQQAGILTAQQQAGALQQQQEQQRLTNAYQDYLNQQNFPYKQAAFMSDILRGMPLTQQAQSVYQAPPTAANQLMGYGLGAYGLSKLFGGPGGAAGGDVKADKKGAKIGKSYKEGGLVMGEGLAKLALQKAMEA